MPSKEESSMQKQTPLSQAQNSVDHFADAVTDAQIHPNETMFRQAREAEERAAHALSQAQSSEHQEPVERQMERFEDQKRRLKETEQTH